MLCPRCKAYHNVLDYVPMKMIEDYASDTTPVYKCPKCRWIFAPAEPLVIVSTQFELPAPEIAQTKEAVAA
jgi:hypothetical protein